MQDIVKEIICNLVMFNNVLLITLQSLQLLNFNNHNATEAISAIVHQNFIAAAVRECFSPRFTVRLISQMRFASSENLTSVGRAGIHVQLKQVPLPLRHCKRAKPLRNVARRRLPGYKSGPM